jgi:hypothetical protein
LHKLLNINWIYQQEGFRAVLRAAGETEATQDNLEDWLQLDGGDLGLGF